ncbi:NACHT domain-containing protein [Streptomyces mirabilis]|uniref:NACHT domain-containing protein n=1 Tax=Streptomyces mirabilis TaxID=68239 RepID=UPI0036BF1987
MAIGGRRLARRWRVVTGLLMGCVAWAMVWAWHAGNGKGLAPPDLAAVVGLPLTIVGVLLAALALRRTDETDIDVLAEDLEQKVKASLGSQRRQMLGDGRSPIDLGFEVMNQVSPRAVVPCPVGRMQGLAAFYRAMEPRRLVIVGSPGAGKTFMAIELILDLLDHRAPDEPVPVRLPLTGWEVAISFEKWLVKRIAAEYNLPVTAAQALVVARRILPVLDGLDEMDTEGDPHAATPRAIAAVEALNGYLDGKVGAPFVLTCRSWRYQALVGAGDGILEAGCIRVSPVTAGQARSYLSDRPVRFSARWTELLDALGPRPDAAPVTWLSTPWRLTMVGTVYARGGNPTELVGFAQQGVVDTHLLSLYVPAAVAMHPIAPKRYSPADTERWLTELAQYLRNEGRQSIGPHDLWRMLGGWRHRMIAGLLGAALAALATVGVDALDFRNYVVLSLGVGCLMAFLPLPVALPTLHVERVDQRAEAVPRLRCDFDNLLTNLGGAVAYLGWVLVLFKEWPAFHDQLARIYHQRSSSGPDTLLVWSEFLSVRNLAAVAVIGALVPAVGICGKLLNTLLSATAAATGRRPAWGPTDSPDPQVPVYRGLLTGMVCAGSLLAVAAVDLVVAGWARDSHRVVLGGLLLALTALLFCALMPFTHAWVWYLVFVLCERGRLPLLPSAFLNWAYEASLLRVSGSAYEFRHRELEDWLLAPGFGGGPPS